MTLFILFIWLGVILILLKYHVLETVESFLIIDRLLKSFLDETRENPLSSHVIDGKIKLTNVDGMSFALRSVHYRVRF